jgi:hypothetical protein
MAAAKRAAVAESGGVRARSGRVGDFAVLSAVGLASGLD